MLGDGTGPIDGDDEPARDSPGQRAGLSRLEMMRLLPNTSPPRPSAGEAAPARVSIVIPVFNRAVMLRHALASIERQTYPNIEVIVVDDGSSDLTEHESSQLNIFHKRGFSFKYVRKQNGGPSSARNAGIVESTGEYIYFLDSDDLMFENAIADLVSCIDRTGAPYGIGRILEVDYSVERTFGETHRDCSGSIMRSSEWCTHASLYRRSAVLAVGGFDDSLRVGEDTIFQITMKILFGGGDRHHAFVGVRRRHHHGHLALNGVSVVDQTRFLDVAADLISHNAVFAREDRRARLRSTAAFLLILARARYHRRHEADRPFETIAKTLLHDSPLELRLLKRLTAPGARLRLVAILLLLSGGKRLRSAATGWFGRTATARNREKLLPEALGRLSRMVDESARR
jgi:glycosyltransferase involved in cell wall biosynthesis